MRSSIFFSISPAPAGLFRNFSPKQDFQERGREGGAADQTGQKIDEIGNDDARASHESLERSIIPRRKDDLVNDPVDEQNDIDEKYDRQIRFQQSV